MVYTFQFAAGQLLNDCIVYGGVDYFSYALLLSTGALERYVDNPLFLGWTKFIKEYISYDELQKLIEKHDIQLDYRARATLSSVG